MTMDGHAHLIEVDEVGRVLTIYRVRGAERQLFTSVKLPEASRGTDRLGATLIPVDALLSSTGRWRYKTKVRQSAPGVFIDGIALWQLLLELLLCHRSVWTGAKLGPNPEADVRVFRTLEIGAGENPPEQWEQLQEESVRWLPTATGHGRHS
jgi:hypothetical protein